MERRARNPVLTLLQWIVLCSITWKLCASCQPYEYLDDDGGCASCYQMCYEDALQKDRGHEKENCLKLCPQYVMDIFMKLPAECEECTKCKSETTAAIIFGILVLILIGMIMFVWWRRGKEIKKLKKRLHVQETGEPPVQTDSVSLDTHDSGVNGSSHMLP